MDRSKVTVNYHLLRACNYSCRYCYANFKDTHSLSLEASYKIIDEISKAGFGKINFAGGEPLLHKKLNEMIVYAKKQNLKTSIITNGSSITEEWFTQICSYLDIIGISCDSSKEESLMQLGRGKGNAIEKIKYAFQIINNYNNYSRNPIYTKLNSVITSVNYKEDMSEFVLSLGVKRWKVFQVLSIKGENDKWIDELGITNLEFSEFVNRHIHLKHSGIEVVPEDNDKMTNSYIMINPEGKFYQNLSGTYIKSEPILKVGLETALKQISFQYSKFLARGGDYRISTPYRMMKELV